MNEKVKWTAGIVVAVFLMGGAAFAETMKLTLEEAIGLGIKNSSTIQAKALGIASAKAALAASRASFYPSVTLSGSWRHKFKEQKTSDMTIPSFGTIPGSYFGGSDPVSFDLNVNQLIYSFGKAKNGVGISDENVKLAEMDFQEEKRKLILEIRKAFYGYILAKEVVKVQEETLKHKVETLDVTKKKYDVGLASDYEVLSAESDVENFRPLLISSTNQVEFALLAVKDLLGVKGNGELQFDLIGVLEPDTVRFEKKELIQRALDNKYEIQSFKKNMNIVEMRKKITKAANKPTFAGFTSYSVDSGFDTETGKNKYWGKDSWSGELTVGTSVQVPLSSLFPWSKERADVAKDEIDYKQMELNLDSIESGIELNIENIILKLDEERAKIDSTKKSVELMQKLYQSSRERYWKGLLASIELRNVEMNLNNAQLGFLQSIYSYKVAVISLMDAVGVEEF